ncbi:MAG: hypothetical protein WC383_16005 [Gammaproteobacteria bacterium]
MDIPLPAARKYGSPIRPESGRSCCGGKAYTVASPLHLQRFDGFLSSRNADHQSRDE